LRRLFVLFERPRTRIAVDAVRIIPDVPGRFADDMVTCRFVSGIRRCDLPLYSRLMGIVFNKALEGRAPWEAVESGGGAKGSASDR